MCMFELVYTRDYETLQDLYRSCVWTSATTKSSGWTLSTAGFSGVWVKLSAHSKNGIGPMLHQKFHMNSPKRQSCNLANPVFWVALQCSRGYWGIMGDTRFDPEIRLLIFPTCPLRLTTRCPETWHLTASFSNCLATPIAVGPTQHDEICKKTPVQT